MTTPTYKLKGNPIVRRIPIIGNLVYDELGKEVLELHNERFRGIDKIEDTHPYEEGQPLSFSNVPRALSYNQILREGFPEMHVLSKEEVVNYWNDIPERDSTYADTDAIVIYPNEGCNEDLRKRVLEIVGKSKTTVPLVVSGLGVDRKDNGFTFTETPFTQTEEAPYLEKDGRISYDPKKGLVSSEEGIPVGVPSDQSGLRGLYRGWSDRLNAWNGVLLGSGVAGRVQILQDSHGYAEVYTTEQLLEVLRNIGIMDGLKEQIVSALRQR